MAIVIPIATTFDAKGLDKASRDIAKAEGGWSKAAAGIKAAALPAAVAIGAIGAASYKAVKDAGNLGETFNAVEKTFGKAGSKITDFGKIAATEAGLSQRAFQELATNTGALLTNMGYSQDEAADSTVNLAKRAADMASVFNTDVDTALEAINAGLRGESEPLRRFGVGLSDAALRAEAAAQKIALPKGPIDANTKALLAESIILKQTNKYQDDFADTADSMANKQRTVEAQIENVSAAFGQALLPAVEKVLGVFESLIGWIAANQGLFQGIIAAIAGIAAAILTLNAAMAVYQAITKVVAAVNLIFGTSFAVALGPLLLVIAAIAAVIAIGILLYKNWDKISAFLKRTWDAIKRFAVDAFGAIKDWIDRTWQSIKDTTSRVWQSIKDFFSTILNVIKTVIQTYISIYVAVFTTAWDLIKTLVTTAIRVVRDVIDTTMAVIRGIIDRYVSIWRSIIDVAMTGIKNVVDTVMGIVKAIFRGDFGAVVDIVRDKVSNLISIVKGIPGRITSALGNLGRLLFNKGKDLIQGLIDGIKSISLSNVVGGILDKINPFAVPSLPATAPYIGPTIRSRGAGAAASPRIMPSTINVTLNGGDPYLVARNLKRALEGYDLTQGRGRGAPLAVSW